MYLGYTFVQYALVVGVLIALCSSLIGVTLVLKQYSFIGTGLSNVAFCSIGIAGIFGVAEFPVMLFITVFFAIWLLARKGKKVSGDSAVALLSVGSLALGYLLLNLFATGANLAGDVCTTLFGSTSILTLTLSDVYMCVILSIVVIIMYIVMYNNIFALTFDEDFGTTSGNNMVKIKMIFSVVVGSIVVLAMNLVGSLLISALMIFPAISSMFLFKSFKSVTICSAILSVIVALVGMLISIVGGTPVGCTIVVAHICVMLVFFLLGKVLKR